MGTVRLLSPMLPVVAALLATATAVAENTMVARKKIPIAIQVSPSVPMSLPPSARTRTKSTTPTAIAATIVDSQ